MELEDFQDSDSFQDDSGPFVMFEQAKAKEKSFKAKLAELEFQKKSGELIERKFVEKQFFDLARKIRNNMLNIPARIMDKLASETDPFEIEKIMTNEIRACLEELSNELDQ